MAMKSHKVLFAGTMGMQMMEFLCACNFQINRVVDGQGKGSSLAAMHAMQRKDWLKIGEVFLDNSTGDIYTFDSHQAGFSPIANAGLHNHKAAQDNREA
jgi:hypothetical protein